MPKRIAGSLFGVGLLVLAISAPLPASALGKIDPIRVVESITPQVLGETSGEAHVVVTPSAEGAVRVDVADRREGDLVIAEGVRFSIEYATGAVEKSDGITVLKTQSDAVNALIQPTPSGVRVLTTIASADAPSAYRYSFDVPDGSELQESAVGYDMISGTEVLGAIYEPWAIDSNGKRLNTTFDWDGGVLTQYVDLLDHGIAFPVVVDPYWGYTFGYNLGKTPVSAWNSLTSCFNCEFPLPGSPAAFPVSNQLIPLYLGIPGVATVNFEVRRAQVSTATNYRAFQLNATANHVDGYGSNIIFEMKYVGGQSKLIVHAYIVNDFWAGNTIYASGAANSWQVFAWNLGS